MSKRKISLDFKRITSAQAGTLAGDTLAQGGYDRAREFTRSVEEAMERGRAVTDKVEQMQKEATLAGALQPLLEGIKERDGHFKGRKIILAIDELHTQIPAQRVKTL